MFDCIAVVGATGAVGREFLDLIASRRPAAHELKLLASARSAGTEIRVGGTTCRVEELSERSFRGVGVAFFSAGGDVSRRFAPAAVESGAVVIDNSSAFRMDPTVPLVVPEVNPQAVRGHRGIIANPNCSTIIMVMAVWPLHRVNPVRRIVVSTYQAVSGAGAAALRELEEQTRDALAGGPLHRRVFPHQIAFNVFSHNTEIDASGYNNEERKMIQETRKIMGVADLAVTATCIRVPVRRAHCESINLSFEHPMTPDEARDALAAAPGVRVVDDTAANHFPMPLEAEGADDVLVGRIRQDVSQPDGCGLDLFVSGDQLRKGAALNGLQIAELLLAPEGRTPAAGGAAPGQAPQG